MATQAAGPPSSARPTGTVTFLFSDIEGSTSRWEQNRDAMVTALARHDALMRAAIEKHAGYIFKTIGDAFCAAFSTAPQAIAAALDAQRALLSENFSAVGELRVRMALHTGHTDERDGDYFGPAVNRVARLLAVAHGAQILVSGACAELLQGALPAQISLSDLGAHRLKDLAQPEHIHQLVAPDLRKQFPELRSLDHLSNNLPPQLTSFVGRDEVVADIKALIEQHRLVTLTGTGGAGKTRCAIQVGAELLDGSYEGIWLAELAPISDRALVATIVAQVLNVQEQPNRSIFDTVLAYLKRKRLLLILDNCEHVIDEARRIAGAILHACPHVHILTTSREPLNTFGEATYRMPSLAIPERPESLFAEGTSGYGAVQLFVDRAVLSNNRFAVTEQNAPYVAEVCRRLDGIPLAIELAAARAKVLSPQQLAQRLDERFRVLKGGDRSSLPRHQTMRALIDWSYDLLADDERALFRKLSIFAGGFTLETASTACSDGRIDELAILDLLSSLVDKSLVQAESAGSGMRYRLLESTRQYAREKLRESGEETMAARAHAEAFVTLTEQLDRDLETTPDHIWFARVEPELENLRAAFTWALSEHGDALLVQQLAGAPRFGWLYFAAAEARRCVRVALATVGAATPVAVVAKLYLAEAEIDAGLMQFNASYAAAEQALARYRNLGDPLGIAHAQRIAGGALAVLGRVAEGELLLTEALAAARALGARRLAAIVREGLASIRSRSNDVAGARAGYAEVLAIYQSLGDELTTANVAANLADAEFLAGNALTALKLAGEALGVDRRLNNTRGVANHLYNMAAYLVALNRYDEARTLAREAVALARDLQVHVLFTLSLQHLAAVAALQIDQERGRGDRVRAARLLGYVDTRLTALEALREHAEQQECDKMLAALRNALEEGELAKLMDEGRDWSEDQAVAEAMLV
jgi:predicted ATPase/class 3 adenylate cyclase